MRTASYGAFMTEYGQRKTRKLRNSPLISSFLLVLSDPDCCPSICQQRSLWSLLEKCILTKSCSQNRTSIANSTKKNLVQIFIEWLL